MKVERCCPDKGWDTAGLCSVLVPLAGAGPYAGHARTEAQIVFNPEYWFLTSKTKVMPLWFFGGEGFPKQALIGRV